MSTFLTDQQVFCGIIAKTPALEQRKTVLKALACKDNCDVQYTLFTVWLCPSSISTGMMRSYFKILQKPRYLFAKLRKVWYSNSVSLIRKGEPIMKKFLSILGLFRI